MMQSLLHALLGMIYSPCSLAISIRQPYIWVSDLLVHQRPAILVVREQGMGVARYIDCSIQAQLSHC